MVEQYDYIMNQIERACQLVAVLISSKKIEQRSDAEINQTLSDLTGLGIELFANKQNTTLLLTLLNMMDDHNKKALSARLLLLKNRELYEGTSQRLLEKIDRTKLSPEVKRLIAIQR